ncbi:unnamed protein product [Dracunculus medinensis]|uniref:Secreted protein n=1 Tax=Dracunculus medinensis TaxID=318479 RepID=A0A0N4UGT6_DRAME|nr:unnamed protein product [Dracunculus medinensis]
MVLAAAICRPLIFAVLLQHTALIFCQGDDSDYDIAKHAAHLPWDLRHQISDAAFQIPVRYLSSLTCFQFKLSSR